MEFKVTLEATVLPSNKTGVCNDIEILNIRSGRLVPMYPPVMRWRKCRSSDHAIVEAGCVGNARTLAGLCVDRPGEERWSSALVMVSNCAVDETERLLVRVVTNSMFTFY